MKFLKYLIPIFFGILTSIVIVAVADPQGVAPYFSIFYAGNPISATNPLPVSGGGSAIGVPTVIPSCPASGYPCGLPTPIPFPAATPLCNAGTALCTFSLNAALPTIAPGNLPGFTLADSAGLTFAEVVPAPTASAASVFAGLPVISTLYAQCGTASLWCPVTSGGQAAAPGTRSAMNVNVCNNTVGTCGVVTGTGADATGNTNMGAPNSYAFLNGFNGTTWDRIKTAASPCPAGILSNGVNSTGANCPVQADTTKAFSGLTVNTITSQLAINGSTSYYISSWSCGSIGTVSLNCEILGGTGTNCASTVTIIDYVAASSASNFYGNRQFVPPYKVPAGDAVCIEVNATTSTNNYGSIYYANF